MPSLTASQGYKVVDFSATSLATATTTAGTAVTGLAGYQSMSIYANIQGGTGGTLDIYIQYSPDEGTTWVDYAHFAQLASGASAIHRVWTVSRAGQQTTIATVGVGTSPTMSAGIIGGEWGDRLRVVMVAGSSTSAGALQTIKCILSR